jgi:hypothetical protein
MYLLLVCFCLRLLLKWIVLIMEKEWLCVKFHTVDSVVCLTTDPYPLPKQLLHINFQYPFFSLKSSSICLHVVSCLPVTSILACIFPSIMCVTRQFLHKIRPIQLAFTHSTIYTILLSCLTVCNTSSFLTQLDQMIFPILLQHHTSKLYMCFVSPFQSVKVSAQHKAMPQLYRFTSFFLTVKSNFLVKRFFYLLKAPFAMAILHHVLLCYPNSEIFHISPIVDV